MEALDQLDELLSCRLDVGRRVVKPCTIVIFGASGDLTARKLIPALYHLYLEKQLPEPFRIVGFARRAKTDAAWRDELLDIWKKNLRDKALNAEVWNAFAANIFYCEGEFHDAAGY